MPSSAHLAYARKKGPGRPPNAWIIYRKTKLPTLPPVAPGQSRRCQAEVSRIISKMWREEPDHVKAEYERMAEEQKALHLRMNPGYKFAPVSRADKDRQKAADAAQKELQRANSKKARAGPYMVPILAAPPSGHIPAAYRDPARLFGQAGPSPHMSGASSPTSTKSAPQPLPLPDQRSQSHATQSSAHSLPIAETYQNQQNYRSSSAPVTYMIPMPPMPPPQTRQVHPPLPNPDLYQPQIHQQPQQHQTVTSELSSWNQISQSDGQVTVHGVTAESYASYQSMIWQADLNMVTHNVLGREDPTNYSMGELDLNTFVDAPGEIEVAMGVQQMPYPDVQSAAPYAQLANLFSTYDYADLIDATSSQITDNNIAGPSQIAAPPSFFSNPPATPTSRAPSSSTAPQQSAMSPITPQSFFDNGVESSRTPSIGSSYAAPQQQQETHSSYAQDVFQQYINFDAFAALSPLDDNTTPPRPAPPSQSQTMPMSTHSSQRTSPSQGPYTPPSAASTHVGIRRVAGSWRPPRSEPDSPTEQSPTGAWAYPVST